jgi:hypothetical protein
MRNNNEWIDSFRTTSFIIIKEFYRFIYSNDLFYR